MVHKCYITLYGEGVVKNMTFSRYIIYGWPHKRADPKRTGNGNAVTITVQDVHTD